MVKGLDLFRERFREFNGSFVLIGGAACDQWFTTQGLQFRVTKDLDIVLIIEVLNVTFIAALRKFIDEGDYKSRERTDDGPPILYRFTEPTNDDYPFMLEFFSRNPEALDLSRDQRITPVRLNQGAHSLSAILLDENYYQLLQDHHDTFDGLAVANANALIPLKACAWLDLTAREEKGEDVDSRDIKKHRNDVFRLAATLPGGAGPFLAESILADLRRFLDAFPEGSNQWSAILSSLKETFPSGGLKPAILVETLRTFFRIGL